MGQKEEPIFIPDQPEHYPRKEDVIGKGREFIDDVITSLEHKELFKKYGIKPDKSFLLEGIAGTGKTYSVKALNNELNKDFVKEYDEYIKLVEAGKEVEDPALQAIFLSYDIGKYGTAFINMGSRTVEQFFETAFYYSLAIPVFVVMDEADALLTKRGGIHSHKEDDKVLETIMKNMQIAHEKDNIYIIMMTNFREQIDNAVLRAGRVDKKYKFELPNETELKELYTKAISDANKKADYQIVRNYNINNLVELSDGFNGADVFNVVNQSVKQKVIDYIKRRQEHVLKKLYVNGTRLEKDILEYQKTFKEKNKVRIGF